MEPMPSPSPSIPLFLPFSLLLLQYPVKHAGRIIDAGGIIAAGRIKDAGGIIVGGGIKDAGGKHLFPFSPFSLLFHLFPHFLRVLTPGLAFLEHSPGDSDLIPRPQALQHRFLWACISPIFWAAPLCTIHTLSRSLSLENRFPPQISPLSPSSSLAKPSEL